MAAAAGVMVVWRPGIYTRLLRTPFRGNRSILTAFRYVFDDFDVDAFVRVAAAFGQERYGYVVTPNVDHMIRLHDEVSCRVLYDDADYVLLDSRFLARLLRLFGGVRPKVCPGSDLTARLLGEVAVAGDRIVLIGGEPDQGRILAERYGLHDLRQHRPPMGFIKDTAAVEACVAFIEAQSPFRFCLLAVGSPQQEVIARSLKIRGRARGLCLCVGASINFLTGAERRAPVWLQRLGLEWLYRLLQNPRRLAHRYLVRGPRVFGILRRVPVELRRAAGS